MEKRRVVVTGFGMVTCLGKTVKDNWERVLKGKSGIARIVSFDPSAHKSQIAGEVRNFKPEEDLAGVISRKEIHKMDRFIQFALFAANAAIKDAGLPLEQLDSKRIGVCVGVGYVGISKLAEEMKKLFEKGPRCISPFLIPGTISNLAAGQISIVFGLKGFNLSITTACAAGTHAIGEGLRSIQWGESDIVCCGGAEAPIEPICIAGFENMGALSTSWNHNPQKASRPFSRDRDGFVIAEGSGILILEEYQHALRRRAKIYGEIVGFARTADGHHITEPSIEGTTECMRLAIHDAKISPNQIGYINAHGTSTPLNDLNETNSIKLLFGDYAYQIPVSSTKSTAGHLIGAAGAIEAIFTILALKYGVAPPTINLDDPGPECDLDYISHKARKIKAEFALSNSFGFGGTNGSLVFAKVH